MMQSDVGKWCAEIINIIVSIIANRRAARHPAQLRRRLSGQVRLNPLLHALCAASIVINVAHHASLISTHH